MFGLHSVKTHLPDLSPTSGTLVFAPNENFRVSLYILLVIVSFVYQALKTSLQILQITAVMDDIPELNETYTITLLDPDALGDLSDTNSSALITILANQNPHGLLELFPIDRYDSVYVYTNLRRCVIVVTCSQCVWSHHSNASSLMVEEDVQYIELEISRSYGTFGEITVMINSVEESAVSPTGKTTLLHADHAFIVGYVHLPR